MNNEITLRALNEYTYCKRLYYLMYIEKIFEDNKDTIEGRLQHEHIIQKQISSNEISLLEEAELLSFVKTLYLRDDRTGLNGKIDTIRVENGMIIPVEYKHSASPHNEFTVKFGQQMIATGAWSNDLAQIAGQLYVLNENNIQSPYGYVYYRQNKKYVKIDYSEEIIKGLIELVSEIQSLSERPLPLVESEKCLRCSLNDICLPEETNFILGKTNSPSRIIAGRKDAGIIHVCTAPKTVSIKAGRVIISELKKQIDSIPIKDVLSVSLYGNVQITTQAMQLLMKNNIPIHFLSSGGMLIGGTYPLNFQNAHLRKIQYVEFNKRTGLALAKRVINAKINNQRTLLRRNSQTSQNVLNSLKELTQLSLKTKDSNSLMGIEGVAARLYFENFNSMLKTENGFDYNGRNKRPPKDPVNALLSLAYTLLLNDVITALITVGFDPMYGFFHSEKPGRPALALDLMESYRPLIADSVVIRAINTKAISISDFNFSKLGCLLTDKSRKKFISLYEQRMDELVTYPKFQYRMSYRRILEIEVRMLARYLEKEISQWKPLTTR